MPKPTRSAVKAATRDLRPFLLAGFVALALTVLAASQAVAQKGSSGDQMLIDMIDICGMLVDQGADAEDALAADDWSIDDVYQYGAFSREISASKVFTDQSDAYAFGVIESYPSAELGFCSLDVQGFTSTINLDVVFENYDAVGSVEQDEFGYWHGSWEANDEGAMYLLLVHFEDENDYLLVQMNRVSGDLAMSSSQSAK